MPVNKEMLIVGDKSMSGVRKAVTLLKKFGVAVFPGFVEHVAPLREECDRAFRAFEVSRGNGDSLGLHEAKNLDPDLSETATGYQLKLQSNGLFAECYPTTAEVFSCDFMRQVSNQFLGTPNSLNRHVILTHDFQPAEETFPFHFDEMNALKFYIYLTPAEQGTAAFEIVPNTQDAGQFIRMSEWHRVDNFRGIRNCVFDEFSEEYFYNIFRRFKALVRLDAVAIDGPAGTMIMFDTDCIHRGGCLAPGQQRIVVRGSSYRGFWPSR